MKREFSHYKEWEDYKNGLYTDIITDEHIEKSIILLSSEEMFYNTSKQMLKDWVVSSKINLTNLGINRKAWLGQATCNYSHKASEESTKKAWWKISKDKQEKANNIANRVINEWCTNYLDKDQLKLFEVDYDKK